MRIACGAHCHAETESVSENSMWGSLSLLLSKAMLSSQLYSIDLKLPCRFFPFKITCSKWMFLAVYRNDLCDMKERVAQQIVYAKAMERNGLDTDQINTEKMIEQQLRTKQVQ